MTPSERSIDVEAAIPLAYREWDRLGLHPIVTPLLEGECRVVNVSVEDASGDVYRHSYGKGKADACLPSGLFEALEHATLRRIRRLGTEFPPWEGSGSVEIMPARTVACQPALERDYFIAQAENGALVWIYRARLPMAAAQGQGWFLQGRFA